MKKTIIPPPRRLPWRTRLYVFNSHVFAVGSWLVIGMGSLFLWGNHMLRQLALTERPNVTVHVENLVWLVFAGIALLGLGLLSLRVVWKQGRMKVRLLRYGEAAYGTWIRSEDENLQRIKQTESFLRGLSGEANNAGQDNSEDRAAAWLDMYAEGQSPDKRAMKSFFRFTAKDGFEHKVKVITSALEVPDLQDEEEELILYNPIRPQQAIPFDAIQYGPSLKPDGQLGPMVPPPPAYLLWVPLGVVLMNVGFFLYYFRENFWG